MISAAAGYVANLIIQFTPKQATAIAGCICVPRTGRPRFGSGTSPGCGPNNSSNPGTFELVPEAVGCGFHASVFAGLQLSWRIL